jgi:hypothetical protein
MEALLYNESLAYKVGCFKQIFVKKLIKGHYFGKNFGKIAFLITFELFLEFFKTNNNQV